MTPPFELREDGKNKLIFTGYAARTEESYRVGWFNETLARGAFSGTLAKRPDVQLNIGHGKLASGLPLARTTNDSLRLAEDSTGLRAEADLDPRDPDVQLLRAKMDSGLLSEMSFAFRLADNDGDSWDHSGDVSVRRVHRVDLDGGDVSVVPRGANPMTSSTLRADGATREERAKLAHELGREVVGVTRGEFRSTLSRRPSGLSIASVPASRISEFRLRLAQRTGDYSKLNPPARPQNIARRRFLTEQERRYLDSLKETRTR